ncbi:MAG: choice-of-anchor D domain-containing protein [Gammaproteobacteria bacterium (ex Lamellibrachia satsuma)]|nr:MAG: choice-of-anchor D domain-containing protein [Gammaproteobacteria bacterium (ex Lamellibrachia satsuma)]
MRSKFQIPTILSLITASLLFSGIVNASTSSLPEETQPIPAALRLKLLEYSLENVTEDYWVDAKEICAENPTSSLHSCFTQDGIQVKSDHGSLHLSLTAWGRGTSLSDVEKVAPSIDKAKIEFARKGLIEWYLNIPQGLEQGFTITDAPTGAGKLVLKLTSQTKAEQNQGAFKWGSIQYGGLYAVDSTGRELATNFSARGNEINIEVDDSHAVYPVIIDPLIEEEVLDASDAEVGRRFANDVAISDDGNTAVVGAEIVNNIFGATYVGAVYVFVKNSGIWTEQTKLTVVGSFRLGASVAVSSDGDTLLAGAYMDGSGTDRPGAAYVFTRNGATWTQQQKLLASDGANNDLFGFSVDLSSDGNTAVIGAYAASISFLGANEGAAYVFRRNGGTWTEQQKLTDVNGDLTDFFGYSVALSGDGNTVISSAIFDEGNSSSEGTALIYAWNGSAWVQQALLAASDAAANDWFGDSTALSFDGNTALVGAPLADVGGNVDQGAAYVYTRNSDVWTEQQKLPAVTGASAGDSFGGAVNGTPGRAVALSDDGNTALIGANGFGAITEGAAFIFLSSGGVWAEDQQLTSSSGWDFARFGNSVALSGNSTKATIGAPFDNNSRGNAYVFGTDAPIITVEDSVAPIDDQQIPFGDVAEFSALDKTVTARNDGSSDLTLGAIAQPGALDTPFSISADNCSSQILTPSSSCTLTVRFEPQSTGAFSDTFDIPSDDPNNNSVTLSLTGTGIGMQVPDITVTDSVVPITDMQIAFGNVTQATSSDETVTITNDGNADLTIGNIATLNGLVAPFNILNDACSGTTVAPTASCTLAVRFEPTAIGAFNDSFDIPSDDADEASVTISVAGTGTAVPVPDITVTDTVAPVDDLQVPFGNVTVASSSDQTVTLANDGTADLIIGQIAQANILAAPFIILNDTCSGQTLVATASCALTVRFAPTAIGAFNDSFDIPSNDADEASVTLSLAGTGTAAQVLAPDITVTDSVAPADDLQVPFGNVTEASSSDRTVTLTNDGTADLIIGQIAQANTLAAPFTILNDSCSMVTLTPTSNCIFMVRFAPTSVADFNDSLDIPSNDADEDPATINVSGSGVAADSTTADSSDDDGIFGIGAFDPLMLLAMFMLSIINLAHRRWRS